MVDPFASLTSDGNGVFEPGETVLVEPAWKNIGSAPVALQGTGSAFTGPAAGPIYNIADAAADYGGIAPGATVNCGATPNCYGMTVSLSPRPVLHWDTTFTETPSTGDVPKVWVLHIGDSFTDVPRSSPFYAKIEALFHNGVTTGCTPTTYCPTQVVSRGQMAIFIAKVMAGGGANVPISGTASGKPYNCAAGGVSIFTDVTPTDQFCKHAHYLVVRNVTLGCSATQFCPAGGVNRDAMAGFLAKAIVAPGGGPAVPLSYSDAGTGLSYSCDAASPNTHFTDVPTTDGFCKHVHFLWAKGIIGGCGGTSYCPGGDVTRDAMAKFLDNAFGLKLYGP